MLRLDKRALVVVGAFAIVVVLTVLVFVLGGDPKHLVSAPQPKVELATPAMVAQKASAGIEDCPSAETTKGGLPVVTLGCLGGGRSVDLSTLKGPLIINVFQAYCTPCRKEMPALEQFHQTAGSVPILGIDANDWMAAAALSQAIQRGVTYPLVADPEGLLQKTDLRVTGYPYTFLLNADGKLTLLKTGGFTSASDIASAVTQALNPVEG